MTNKGPISYWMPFALWFIAIAFILLAYSLFRSAEISNLVVQGDSMAPHFVQGQRISIDPLSQPKRWDPVVLRSPDEPNRLLVKRVIGLPGESVSLKQGDVWINNQLISKSLEQQKRMLVLVAKESVPSSYAGSWKNESGWQRLTNSWHFQPDGLIKRATLSYDKEVTDDLIANNQLSRKVNLVQDIALEFRVKLDQAANLQVVLRGISIQLSGAGKLRIMSDKEIGKPSSKLPVCSPFDFYFSVFDGRATIAVDGEQILCWAIQSADVDATQVAPILLIASAGEATIQELSVWRDVYYEDLNQLDGDTWQMGPDEWFVLGDNPPVSEDSRNWDAPAGVPTESILGVVR